MPRNALIGLLLLRFTVSSLLLVFSWEQAFAATIEAGDSAHQRQALIASYQKLHKPNQAPPPKSSRHLLRILSWNVRKFRGVDDRHQLANIVSALREAEAEVVALQETFQNHERHGDKVIEIAHEWEQELKQLGVGAKPYQVYKCFPKVADGQELELSLRQQALSLLSNQKVESAHCEIFPLSLQHDAWKDIRWGFQTAILLTDKGRVGLINTHLDVEEITRLRQIQVILAYIDQHIPAAMPLFLMGDFNALNLRQLQANGDLERILRQDVARQSASSFYELEELYRNGFQEVFDLGDWLVPKVSVWSLRRVDYIFARPNLGFTLKPYALPWVYSDHLPLVVDIQ